MTSYIKINADFAQKMGDFTHAQTGVKFTVRHDDKGYAVIKLEGSQEGIAAIKIGHEKSAARAGYTYSGSTADYFDSIKGNEVEEKPLT